MWFIGQLGKHLECLQEYPHSSVLEFFKKNLYTSTLMIVAVYIFSLFFERSTH